MKSLSVIRNWNRPHPTTSTWAPLLFPQHGLVSAGIFYKKIDDFIVDQVSTNYEYQGNVYTRFTQPKNAGNANLLGVELSYQRDFGFIAPLRSASATELTPIRLPRRRLQLRRARKRRRPQYAGFTGTHRQCFALFSKAGLNIRMARQFRFRLYRWNGWKALSTTVTTTKWTTWTPMQAIRSGKKIKTTFYAEANNLLNQPPLLPGTKDRTMQSRILRCKGECRSED